MADPKQRELVKWAEENFPDNPVDAAAVMLDVAIPLVIACVPSAESARLLMHTVIDDWFRDNASAADKHFKHVQPKVN